MRRVLFTSAFLAIGPRPTRPAERPRLPRRAVPLIRANMTWVSAGFPGASPRAPKEAAHA
jgi:hypothetical protein